MIRFAQRLLLVLPLCALAAGCLTTSGEDQAKLNEQRCVNRGYKPGTDDFADCVVRIEGENESRKETRRRYEIERPTDPTAGTRGY